MIINVLTWITQQKLLVQISLKKLNQNLSVDKKQEN